MNFVLYPYNQLYFGIYTATAGVNFELSVTQCKQPHLLLLNK
jgi:hypothetical protein